MHVEPGIAMCRIDEEGSETFEREASKCNAMKDLSKAADRYPDFKDEALNSDEPVNSVY